MKRCTKCNEPKAFTEFYRNKSAKDGHGSWCKLCISDDTKAKRQANPLRYRGYSKRCNDKHRAKRRLQSQRWYEQNRERKIAKVKQQRKENPSRFRLYSAKCYLKNIEKRKAYAKRYRQNNLERFRQQAEAYAEDGDGYDWTPELPPPADLARQIKAQYSAGDIATLVAELVSIPY